MIWVPSVPQEGFEPPRANAHYALNVARLPIPPLRLDTVPYIMQDYFLSNRLPVKRCLRRCFIAFATVRVGRT